MNKFCFVYILMIFSSAGYSQEVKITDSLWDDAMLHRSLQIQQKIHQLVLDNQLNAFELPDSKYPIGPSELKSIGNVKMHVAAGADDGSDTTIEILFSAESFTGYGFNRQVNNDLNSASTVVQLDYVSLLFTMEGSGLYFEETVLYYLSMTDLVAALTYDEINFLRVIDVMAKRLQSFKISKSFKSKYLGKTVKKHIYDVEQNVSMHELIGQNEGDQSTLFASLSSYLSSNGMVYKNSKLTKAIREPSKLDTVEVLLSGDNLSYFRTDSSDSLTILYELNEKTSVAFISKNKTNQIVLKVLPKKNRPDMVIKLRCKTNEFYIPMSALITSTNGENRVHLQTILNYLKDFI